MSSTMLPEIEKLLVLQERDRRIRALKQELKTAPAERAELERRLESTSASFLSLKHKTKELEVEKKNLELSAQAKRDSIAKFRTQQFQTRKNEEFQALGNEIKRYGEDIQSLEDKELQLMEDLEKANSSVNLADKELAKTKASIEAQMSEIEKKVVTIEGQLLEAEGERARLAEGVDEDLLNRYERLFASKGDAAVVGLEHEVCTGCHMKITTQTAVRVKGNREIVNCEQCGRILYHSD